MANSTFFCLNVYCSLGTAFSQDFGESKPSKCVFLRTKHRGRWIVRNLNSEDKEKSCKQDSTGFSVEFLFSELCSRFLLCFHSSRCRSVSIGWNLLCFLTGVRYETISRDHLFVGAIIIYKRRGAQCCFTNYCRTLLREVEGESRMYFKSLRHVRRSF